MYQQLTLIGYLGGDPEMRYLPSGQSVTNFSIATSRKWTDSKDSTKREETVWWRVSAFGPIGEATNQYKKKGDLVLVEGRMRPDSNGGPRVFQRQDGSFGASYEINASRIQFLPKGSGNGGRDYANGNGLDAEDDSMAIPF